VFAKGQLRRSHKEYKALDFIAKTRKISSVLIASKTLCILRENGAQASLLLSGGACRFRVFSVCL